MEAKKRMSNKAFGRLWYTLLALLLIVTLVANYFAMKYTTIITRSLGHTTTKVITTTDSAGDSQYFQSDYASHDELDDGRSRSLCQRDRGRNALETHGSTTPCFYTDDAHPGRPHWETGICDGA